MASVSLSRLLNITHQASHVVNTLASHSSTNIHSGCLYSVTVPIHHSPLSWQVAAWWQLAIKENLLATRMTARWRWRRQDILPIELAPSPNGWPEENSVANKAGEWAEAISGWAARYCCCATDVPQLSMDNLDVLVRSHCCDSRHQFAPLIKLHTATDHGR